MRSVKDIWAQSCFSRLLYRRL